MLNRVAACTENCANAAHDGGASANAASRARLTCQVGFTSQAHASGRAAEQTNRIPG